ERLRVEVGMESGAVSADDAMRRPAIDEVRGLGEVAARVDVMVAGGHYDVIIALPGVRVLPRGQDLGNREGNLRPAVHAHASAFTEVVLHVDDDQRLMRIHLDNLSSNRVGITGSPRDICVAAGGSSAQEAACRSRAVDNG